VFAGLRDSAGYAAATSSHERRPIVRLRAEWTREDFCRGWLITGDTAPEKRVRDHAAAIPSVPERTALGRPLYDDKGIYWKPSRRWPPFQPAKRFDPAPSPTDNAPFSWKPTHTYNLTSDAVSRTARSPVRRGHGRSLGQQGDKGFFRASADAHRTRIEALYELQADVTLENAHELC